jgi:MoaA/NifB/PqqE/SkfB family radical SAM enzyme
MDNNNIIFVNKQMDYMAFSVEQVHSFGLNHWKNWWCSAGIRSIYIDFDGNVFRGTCGVGGWIGNVNKVTGLNHGTDLTGAKWVSCTKEVCSCGADMAVPKVKDKEDILQFFNKNSTSRDTIQLTNKDDKVNPDIVFSYGSNTFKTIIWDLGRRCNFACWYCSKNSHNNFETHKNYEMLEAAFNNINKNWMFGERTKFVITGGEPTVYKDYLPFVQMLKEKNHVVHTTTNGSNTPKYYSELAEVSDIVFSIHLNYVKQFGIDKFVNAVLAATETTKRGHENNTVAKYNWVIARIMLDPGNLEIAKEIYRELNEKCSPYKNFVLVVDLVHQTDQGSHLLFEYNEEELAWIKNQGK